MRCCGWEEILPMSRVVSGALWRMKKALRDWWRSKGLSGGELCRPDEERSRALECLPNVRR